VFKVLFVDESHTPISGRNKYYVNDQGSKGSKTILTSRNKWYDKKVQSRLMTLAINGENGNQKQHSPDSVLKIRWSKKDTTFVVNDICGRYS